MLPKETSVDAFEAFVMQTEGRLRRALTAVFGFDVGKDAAAEALAYGWEHWDKVEAMDNPAGYLYRVGYDRGRRMLGRRKPRYPSLPSTHTPWVEPALTGALADLPERQRSVVFLLYAYEWTMSEVAETLGISKASVQKHANRGLSKLRKKLGVLT